MTTSLRNGPNAEVVTARGSAAVIGCGGIDPVAGFFFGAHIAQTDVVAPFLAFEIQLRIGGGAAFFQAVSGGEVAARDRVAIGQTVELSQLFRREVPDVAREIAAEA